MQRNRLFVASFVLAVALGQPPAILSEGKSSQEGCAQKSSSQGDCAQGKSANETYEGVPLCRTSRGVFPRPVYQPEPEYDDKSRKKRVQGTVTLSVIVTTEGRTADIKVLKTLTPELDRQAINTLSRWRFEPAEQDGQPCPTRVNVQMAFRLY